MPEMASNERAAVSEQSFDWAVDQHTEVLPTKRPTSYEMGLAQICKLANRSTHSAANGFVSPITPVHSTHCSGLRIDVAPPETPRTIIRALS